MAAEKIKLGLGGKMEQYFGVTSQDDAPGFDPTTTGIATDTEVYFSGATTLDNGLTIGAMIQLEAQTNATPQNENADEQYAYIEGAFGQIQAGQKEGVHAQMAHEAPQYGLADDDFGDWFAPGDYYAGFMNGWNGLDTTLSNDDASISYISPSLAGFSVGLTWTPSPGGALQANTVTNAHNQYEAAIAYNGEFGGVAIGADVAYIGESGADDNNATTTDQAAWRGGLVIGYAGFEVGGSYLRTDDNDGARGDDREVWNAGIGYRTGPYGVSITYTASTLDYGNGNKDKLYNVYLGGTYAMGPGVTLVGALYHAEAERRLANAPDPEDVDALGAVVGLQLEF
ncbi:porin [Caenispirillum bisanense]